MEEPKNINENSTQTFILSPKGRIGRQEFFKWYLGFYAIFALFGILGLTESPLGIAVDVLLLWPSLCLYFKRGHDAGISNWITFFGTLIALFLLYSVFEGTIFDNDILGFEVLVDLGILALPSKNEGNPYGDTPQAITLKRNSTFTFTSVYAACTVVVTLFLMFLVADSPAPDEDKMAQIFTNYYNENKQALFEKYHHPLGSVKTVIVDDLKKSQNDEVITVVYTIYSSTPMTSDGFTTVKAIWKWDQLKMSYLPVNEVVLNSNIMGKGEFWKTATDVGIDFLKILFAL